MLDHASRPQRPRDPADFLLLEETAAHPYRPRPQSQSYRRISETKDAAYPVHAAHRIAESSTSPASPTAGWNFNTPNFLDESKPCLPSSSVCTRGPISPAGTEGYDKAEVTAGGVDTAELSAKNHGKPQSARPLLHRRSGRRNRSPWRLNFQWAWSSGAAAGRAL